MMWTMRRQTPRILLILLCVVHLGVTAGRIHRQPAIIKTFHDHDVEVLRAALVLTGHRRAESLPVRDLLPIDADPSEGFGREELLAYVIANSPKRTRLYQTMLPLHTLMASVPSLLFGLSPMALRLGTIPFLWALLWLVFDMARRLTDRPGAGLTAAVVLGSLPAVFTATLIGTPVLGNMLAATLPIWALVRSQHLSRPLWALLTGVLLALAPRWGESAGDGIEVLLVTIAPLFVTALHTAVLLFRPRHWLLALRGLLGWGLMVGVMSVLMDRWWLLIHLSEYLLDEAGSAAADSVVQRIWSLLDMLSVDPWDYPETLLWSLLGPAALTVLGLGALLSLRRVSWHVVMLWGAVLGPMVILTLSEKRQDFYIAPMLPLLCTLGGVGLARLGRLGWLATMVPVLVWLGQAHADVKRLQDPLCHPVLRTWVAVEPSSCDNLTKHFGVHHYFREWRRTPEPQKLVRDQIARWGRDAEWLDALPPKSAIWIQRPVGHGGGGDALYYSLQSQRPDLQVHFLDSHALRLDSIAEHHWKNAPELWLITLMDNVIPPMSPPESPMLILRSSAEWVEGKSYLRRYRLKNRLP